MITERQNVACRLIMKAISKGSLAGCSVHLDAGSTNLWPNKTFKFLSMLITGLYPAGFLVLVYLLEINSPLATPLPKNPNRQPLLICTTGRCHTQDNPAEMYGESTSSIST